MKIERILNNNTAILKDTIGQQYLAMGKGLSFQKKTGMIVSKQEIENLFVIKRKGTTDRLSSIIEEIPFDHLKICDEIINTAYQEMGKKLDDTVYLALLDHITFAIKRVGSGSSLAYSLKWELKQFYPDEYRIAQKALEIINQRLDLDLPDDEVAYIALHFVNSEYSDKKIVQKTLKFVNSVLKIVNDYFGTTINQDSYAYSRFVKHLQYFSQVILSSKSGNSVNNYQEPIFSFKEDLKQERECVELIEEWIKEKYSHVLTEAEKNYLIMHMFSLLNRK